MRAVWTIACVLWALMGMAQTTQEWFEEGNEWYQTGNMQEAVLAYERALEDGIHSAALEYNLGNAYFNLSKIGLALVHYERALLLQPNDEEILHNLQIAKNARIDKITPLPQTFMSKLFESYSTIFEKNTWYVLSILFVLLCAAGIVVVVRSKQLGIKRGAFVLFWITLALGAWTLITALQMDRLENSRALIIVVQKNSYVKNAPEPTATDLFILHEGSYGYRKESRNGYYRIVLEDGKIGWLPEEDVMEVR